MARLNLTLDADTFSRLERHAKNARERHATFARRLLRDALIRQESLERARALARDYAAGRADARSALRDLEAAQLELLDDDEA